MDEYKINVDPGTSPLRHLTNTPDFSAEDIDKIAELIRTNPEEANEYFSLHFFIY